MKVLWIILGIMAVLIVGTILFFMIVLPKKKDYKHLVHPRIIDKEEITVLAVPFEGDAERAIKTAFTDLFKCYYKIKGLPKGPSQPASIARYEFEEGTEQMTEEELKKMTWRGFAALPVPEGTTLPQGAPETARIEKLSYGTVAEMIHFGPYEAEQPNIRRLKDFINAEGYKIIGIHEEEYIVGPGLPLIGPKKYITFIRYNIEKKE